nr:uncharacterized protein C5orf47 homolog [Anolis sagrei ordinatus]
MKPVNGSRFGRNRFRIVYVNHFGSHRCGSVIHYGSGHLRPEGQAPLATPISERRGCATLSPSPQGQKSPCFVLRAGPKMQAGKAGACGSRPLGREGQAASTTAKDMPELPCTPSADWSCEREAVSSTASSRQKQTGMSRAHIRFPRLYRQWREENKISIKLVRSDLTLPSFRAKVYWLDNSSLNECNPIVLIGDCQESRRDVFEFSAPLENANNLIRKHKEKSAVWHRVSKVISKMIEENGHFRNRLKLSSQLSNEGRDVNENIATEASCMDAVSKTVSSTK